MRAVEDVPEHAGTELDLQRTAGVLHGLADAQPRRVLVDLDRGRAPVQPDDFARQLSLTDADHVVQPRSPESSGNDDRSGDAPDLARSVEVVVGGAVVALGWCSWVRPFVAERDAVADGLPEQLEESISSFFGVFGCAAGGKRRPRAASEWVESLSKWCGELVVVRGVDGDHAVLGGQQLLEPGLRLVGGGDLDRGAPPSW